MAILVVALNIMALYILHNTRHKISVPPEKKTLVFGAHYLLIITGSLITVIAAWGIYGAWKEKTFPLLSVSKELDCVVFLRMGVLRLL